MPFFESEFTEVSLFLGKYAVHRMGILGSQMTNKMPDVSSRQVRQLCVSWISTVLIGLILICSGNPGGLPLNDSVDAARRGVSEEPVKPANETADPFDEVAKCAQVRAHRSSREVADEFYPLANCSVVNFASSAGARSWCFKSQPCPGKRAPDLPDLQVWRI